LVIGLHFALRERRTVGPSMDGLSCECRSIKQDAVASESKPLPRYEYSLTEK